MANKDKTAAGVDTLTQVSESVRNSSNILIALSKDPSIDELTAALSLALILDKFGKHATAIFSGTTPNIISFLQPESTFETNTNSLQDFIIALDKEKADHIRYKIDGDFVKVFITPYKTTLNEKDLEFSHGDFNVDLVIALNVKSEAELDSALVEYGRIKHDASSINISPAAPGNFGDIEWGDPNASSVCEMVYRLAIDLQDPESPLIDENTATAILTGVISATNRFSNERTTADTLSVASNLLAYGANQQLIAKNIPVDILTAPATPAEEAKPEAEPAAEPVVKPVVEPKAEEKPADPTNFAITHQGKKNSEKPVEQKKEQDAAPAIKPNEAPAKEPVAEPIAPEPKDAKSEAARIVAEAEQKQADEKAKAEEEEKRKREEQEAREKAEAEKNQAAKDAVLAKVNAERNAPKAESILPPTPPKEFVSEPKTQEPVAEPLAEPIAEPVNTKAPDLAPIHDNLNEPSVIPNALPADGNVLPPPPAPFDAGNADAMPPVLPVNEPAKATPVVNEISVVETAPVASEPPAPAEAQSKIPSASEIVAQYQAKKAAAAKTEASAPVMPAVTMPSQGDVARALNNAQPAPAPATQAAPVAAPAPAAPTLAPRPAVTPTAPTAAPAAAPATPAPAAPAAGNPVSDPGAFHIPGM